jgi:hypothetical protein
MSLKRKTNSRFAMRSDISLPFLEEYAIATSSNSTSSYPTALRLIFNIISRQSLAFSSSFFRLGLSAQNFI